ncbi:MAG: lipoyl(octanoyl) transferase LipB [Planctomycetota bacterium]|nr:lipoyl(octanoyl) transferase LipB [Planctomycetota bacterium]
MTGSRSGTSSEEGALRVVELGRIDYAKAWDLQRETVDGRIAGEIPDTLFLCEHNPVITTGRGTKEGFLLEPERFPVIDIERGGEATWHGPGQLVAYPVLALPEGRRDLHRYLRDLEEVLLRTLTHFGLEGERRSGWTGAWVGERKVASIGVAVRRWVTYHGLALNVCPDLSVFTALRPCGLDAAQMTSLSGLLGRELGLDEVKEPLAEAFAAIFKRRILGTT